MLGFDYLLAGHLILADYQVKCELKAAPQISVSASGLDVAVDTTKGIRDLDAMTPDMDTPFEKGAEVHREGIRMGRIGVTGQYKFDTETYTQLNKVCMYVSEVKVNIHLDPTIYIAREFPRGTCHYNAVMEHEMKHVKLDREVVNRYTGTIAKAIDNTLKKIGYAQGPYDASQLPALQKQISGIIDSVVEQFSNNLNRENNYLQKTKIDTLEEYRRVDALCPDKPRPKL